MLILGRKDGQSIRINNNIRLKLLGHSREYIRVLLETGQSKAILNRPPGKPLFDEQGIYVSTSHSQGSIVRFAIRAPKEVGIWREELWLQMNGQAHQSGKNKAVA